MAAELTITLKRSWIGFEKSQGLTAKALGLNKTGAVVTRPDNESVRGMIFKIKHLVTVSPVAGEGSEAS